MLDLLRSRWVAGEPFQKLLEQVQDSAAEAVSRFSKLKGVAYHCVRCNASSSPVQQFAL